MINVKVKKKGLIAIIHQELTSVRITTKLIFLRWALFSMRSLKEKILFKTRTSIVYVR